MDMLNIINWNLLRQQQQDPTSPLKSGESRKCVLCFSKHHHPFRLQALQSENFTTQKGLHLYKAPLGDLFNHLSHFGFWLCFEY